MSDLSFCTARLTVVQRIHRMVTMGSTGGWNRMEDIAGHGSDSDDERSVFITLPMNVERISKRYAKSWIRVRQ